MKLYELTQELNALEHKMEAWAIEREGDITDFPFADELEAIEGDKQEKALNIARFIKNLQAEAGAIKAEADKLTARAKSLTTKATNMKNYLQINLEPGVKFKDSNSQIGWRKSESVEVSCEVQELPDSFQKVTVAPDKTGLKKALKAGDEVEGVSLVVKQNIQVK